MMDFCWGIFMSALKACDAAHLGYRIHVFALCFCLCGHDALCFTFSPMLGLDAVSPAVTPKLTFACFTYAICMAVLPPLPLGQRL